MIGSRVPTSILPPPTTQGASGVGTALRGSSGSKDEEGDLQKQGKRRLKEEEEAKAYASEHLAVAASGGATQVEPSEGECHRML